MQLKANPEPYHIRREPVKLKESDIGMLAIYILSITAFVLGFLFALLFYYNASISDNPSIKVALREKATICAIYSSLSTILYVIFFFYI